MNCKSQTAPTACAIRIKREANITPKDEEMKENNERRKKHKWITQTFEGSTHCTDKGATCNT